MDNNPQLFEVDFLSAKDGYPLICLRKEGEDKGIPLSSQYSPHKEAERILEDSGNEKENYQIIFIFGAGNPSLILLALEKYQEIPIAVMENHPRIRQLVIDWLQTNHRPLFNKNESRLLWGDTHITEQNLRKWFVKYSVKKLLFLFNQKQTQLYPDFFSKLKDRVMEIHNERASNRSTISRFEKIWLRNITRNTTQIIKSYPLLGCQDRGKGLPAVVVGAGPSLEEILPELKAIQERVVLITADTAVKVLLNRGIIPDLVVSIDPQKVNSRYLENLPDQALSRTVLICEPGVGNQGIRHFPYQIMFDSIFPYYRFLTGFFQPKGEIDIGGTVISAAYEVAQLFQFSPVAFTGMDFCFREDTYHLPGTMYEEIFFSCLHRYQTFEMFFSQIINHEIIPVPNHLGEVVYMDRKFILFKTWLEKKLSQEKREMYNCSKGGVALTGLPHLPFHEFIEKIPPVTKAGFMTQLLEEITRFQNERNSTQIEFSRLLDVFQTEFQKLVSIIEQYQKILYRSLRHIRNRNRKNILASQEEIIQGRVAKIAKPFVEIVIQKTLFDISQSGKGSEDEEYENLRHLYQELYDACSLNLKYLKKTRVEGKKLYTDPRGSRTDREVS